MITAIGTYILNGHFGDKKAIEMIKKAGFEGIDYSLFTSAGAPDFLENDYREYALDLKAYLDEMGISCNQAHAPLFLEYGSDFDVRVKEYADVVKSIEFASILGVKYLVVHAIQTPDGVDMFSYNYEYFKSLQSYCEKFKVYIAIENIFGYGEANGGITKFMSTSRELLKLLEMLDSEWFVCCVDVGHAAITGTEPEDFIEHIKNDKLKTLHIHDNDHIQDWHLLPYSGNMNWDNITKAIAEADYSGELTLEVVGFLERLESDLLFDGLCFASKIAHRLVDKIEKSK